MNKKELLNRIDVEMRHCEHNISVFEEATGHRWGDMPTSRMKERFFSFEAGYYSALKKIKRIIRGDKE